MDYFEIRKKLVELDYSIEFDKIREESGYDNLSDYRDFLYKEITEILIKKINLPYITDLWFEYDGINNILYNNCEKLNSILNSYFIESNTFNMFGFLMDDVKYFLQDDTEYYESVNEYYFIINIDTYNNDSDQLWLMNLTQ